MKKTFFLFLITLGMSSLLITSSCSDDDEKTPADLIVGQWTMNSVQVLGQTITADGSYLIFNECDGGTCTGVDYDGTDSTSGTFVYTLNSEGTILTIKDNSPSGGYDFTADVLDLTDTKLRFTMVDPLFGDILMDYRK